MSFSNCRFILIVDADPSAYFSPLPANVTAIWSDIPAGRAYDVDKAGLLLQIVVEALKKIRTWTAKSLADFIQEESKKPSRKLISQGRRIVGDRDSVQPWVQSFLPDTPLVFPDENTPKAKVYSSFNSIVEGLKR